MTDTDRALARLTRTTWLALAVAVLAVALAAFAILRKPTASALIAKADDHRVRIDEEGLWIEDPDGNLRAALRFEPDGAGLELVAPGSGARVHLTAGAKAARVEVTSGSDVLAELEVRDHHGALSMSRLAPDDKGWSDQIMLSVDKDTGARLGLSRQKGVTDTQQTSLGVTAVDGTGPVLDMLRGHDQLQLLDWESGPMLQLSRDGRSFWATPSPPRAAP